ncbi:hypothetical protein [Faecalimonas sp.]
MKFSFDESARSEIRGFFEEALGSAGTETMNLFNELVAIYTREQYKPLYTMTSEIAEYYTQDFHNVVQEQFENWVDSETSITAFADELEASDDSSDDAYVAAQYLQGDLQNALDELFSNQPDVPSVSTEAHLTKDDNEIFEEVDELLQKFEDALEGLISDYNSKADTNSEDNQLYSNVSEILEAILESYKSLFDVFKEGVSNLASHISERGSSAESKSETDKDQMKTQAESVGEALRDVSGLFDFG